MTDVARDKFMRLMQEIDGLEQQVEALQQKLSSSPGSPDPRDGELTPRKLHELLERLEQRRTELSRISNACRRPHP